MAGVCSCNSEGTLQLFPPTLAPNQADNCAWRSFLVTEKLEDEQLVLPVLRSGTCQVRRVCPPHIPYLPSVLHLPGAFLFLLPFWP